MGLAIVTAIYGGYDTLAPLPPDHWFDDAICVTDDPQLHAEGWRMIVDPSDDHPRLAAKAARCTPWKYIDVDHSVWIDGAFTVRSGSLAKAARDLAGQFDVVAFAHPEPRTCLFQEAEYCQDWPKYASNQIREQTAFYAAKGMPRDYGLYACGGLLWDHTRGRAFGDMWLAECHQWSIQDQVSFPWVEWRLAAHVGVWPFHEFNNDHLIYRPHLRDV